MSLLAVCEEGFHVHFIHIFTSVQQNEHVNLLLWSTTRHSEIKHQWETQGSSSIYYCTFSFTLIHLCFLMFQSIFIFFPLFHLNHLLQLPVPHSSLLSHPPSNIQLTHNCGTLSPVLPINPHHRHLGPLSRLSLSTCIQNSQRLGHFSRECLSVFHRPWGTLLNMLFTVQPD